MESCCLLFLILIISFTFDFLKTGRQTYVFYILFLYFLIIFTHERYVLLLPFLLFVFILNNKIELRDRINYSIFSLIIFFSNYSIVSNILKEEYFLGSGRELIKFNFWQISSFIKTGFLNIISIPFGETQFIGKHFIALGFYEKIPIVLFIILLLVILYYFFKGQKVSVRFNNYFLVLLLILFVFMLFSASITVRQELRWIYPVYLVFLIVFYFFISNANLELSRISILVFLFLSLTVTNELCFQQHYKDTLLFKRQSAADSLNEATLGRLGNSLNKYEIYVESTESSINDSRWWSGYGTFFRPLTNSAVAFTIFTDISSIRNLRNGRIPLVLYFSKINNIFVAASLYSKS